MGAMKGAFDSDLLTTQLSKIRGQKVYFDTNIIIYVINNTAEFVDVCIPFFEAIENGDIIGCSGDVTIAELLVKPMQINDMLAISNIKAMFDVGGYFETFAHDRATFELAAHIRATKGLKFIDALHTATAINNGCGCIITNDKPLARKVTGLEAVDIKDFLINTQ
jgi:predicted nucleic acid-binding protein